MPLCPYAPMPLCPYAAMPLCHSEVAGGVSPARRAIRRRSGEEQRLACELAAIPERVGADGAQQVNALHGRVEIHGDAPCLHRRARIDVVSRNAAEGRGAE